MTKTTTAALLFLLFSSGLVCAQADAASTSGGYIEHYLINLYINQTSYWGSLLGKTNSSLALPFSLNVTAGGSSVLNIMTGESSCDYGAKVVNLLFSNSSDSIISLSAGNLGELDATIPRFWDNGTTTFKTTGSFLTSKWGNITEVPTTYTNSPAPNSFVLGYMQDQNGSLVFITRVSKNSPAYNDSEVDFQAMLPTRNGSVAAYYGTVDVVCNPPPPPSPGGEGGSSGGGGGIGGSAVGGPGKTNVTPPQPACSALGGACTRIGDCCEGECLNFTCKKKEPTSEKSEVYVLAPSYVQIGEVVFRLQSSNGSGINGAEVLIISPSKELTRTFTDKNGEAHFIATEEGQYAYTIPGYNKSGVFYVGSKTTRISEIVNDAQSFISNILPFQETIPSYVIWVLIGVPLISFLLLLTVFTALRKEIKSKLSRISRKNRTIHTMIRIKHLLSPPGKRKHK